MKKTIIKMWLLNLLCCFIVNAQDNIPFDLDYPEKKSNNPIEFYSILRAIYGQGINSNIAGRTQIDNEQLRLGFRYRQHLPYNMFFKGDIRGVFQHRQRENNLLTNEIWDGRFEVRQLYLENRRIVESLPFGLLAGRKQFRDNRGWWYDNQLDVAQLQYNSTLFSASFSYGGRIIDERFVSETQNIGFEDSQFFIGHADYHYYYNHHIQPFVIYQTDDFSNNKIGKLVNIDSSLKPELDLVWVGVRFNGLFFLPDRSHLDYWADVATVSGTVRNFATTNVSSNVNSITAIRSIDVSQSYGLDLGVIWKAAEDSWGVSINYAHGSGDDSDSDNQSSYRQPAIANNRGRVLGPSRDRIYGELLRPELTNIQLVGISTGARLNKYLWLQGSYFHYWQIEASRQLTASNLSITPNGRNKEIGNEVDLTLVATWLDHLSTQLTLSGFHAGSAFNRVSGSDYAYKGVLVFKFRW